MTTARSGITLGSILALFFFAGGCTTGGLSGGPAAPIDAGNGSTQDGGVNGYDGAGGTDSLWPDGHGPGDGDGMGADGWYNPDGCCGGPVCTEAQLCNPVSCACEEVYQGVCDAVDDPCDPLMIEPLPFFCAGYGDGDGICREACNGPPILEDPENPWEHTCSQGTMCGALPGTSGYCVPAGCDGFFDNTCGPDATCLPTLNAINACVPDGSGEEGDDCELHSACGHDLLCVSGVCGRPDCTALSNSKPCANGQMCTPAMVGVDALDLGYCVDSCDVFYPGDCPDGQWCYPVINAPAPGPIDGYCTPDVGNGQDGDSCENDPNICDAEHMCIQSSEGIFCERICDPDTAPPVPVGACNQGEACIPLLVPNDFGQLAEVMDFGSCVPGCEPWVSQSASGCSEISWCIPTLFNPDDGECKGDLGPVGKGQPCDDSALEATCGAGMLCLDVEGGVPLSGVCRLLCDPDGQGICDPGTEACEPLSLVGADQEVFSVGIGWCRPL